MMKQKGKKTRIIIKFDQIHQLVQERGSRSKISYLKGSLNQFCKNLINGNEELVNFTVLTEADGTSNNWIEEIQFEFYSFNGNIKAYLESNKNEPPPETQCHNMNN